MLTRPVLALAVLHLVWPLTAWAQGTPAGVVTRLEGTVTAARASLPQPVALKFKDGVFVNDRIVTGDRSLVRMLLGGKAVVTVRERSSLTITELPGRSTVSLESGKIALAVARERMRSGESIEIRTPSAVAGIRGTVVIAEHKETTARPGGITTFFGLTGTFEAIFGIHSFVVGAGQFASGDAAGGNSGTTTAEMLAEALSGLQMPVAEARPGGQDAAKERALGTTLATFGQHLVAVQRNAGGGVESLIASNLPTPNPVQPPILPGGEPAIPSAGNSAATVAAPAAVDGHTTPDGLFELVGRPGFIMADPDPDPVTGAPTGLVFGTDRPLQPGPGAAVFHPDAGAVVAVRGSLYRVDTALLEATTPLLLLTGNSSVATGRHAVDLTTRAKVSIPHDAVAMLNVDRGTLSVQNGNLVNLEAGSRLNVAGDLLRIGAGSTVTISNGALLNVSGGSVASIDGALVRFTGTGGVLNVTNTLVPNRFLSGVPVYVAPGATANLSIGAGALVGLNLGTIRINNSPLSTSAPAGAVTGSLVTVQGTGGSVSVGRN